MQTVPGAPQHGPVSAHVDSIERQTGRRPMLRGTEQEIEAPQCPEVLTYIWEYFAELLGRRSSNGVGLNPLSFPDIEAWARLTGRDIEPWEVSLLLRLDDVSREKPPEGGG